MKTILTLAALVTCLAGPAMAEEAATAPASVPQAGEAVAVQVLPAALPQSKPAQEAPMSAPMSTPDEQSGASMASGGGGCGHAKKTVYLTN